MLKNKGQCTQSNFYEYIKKGKYLDMQNRVKVACFMDLLTGRKNQFHLAMFQSVGIVDV